MRSALSGKINLEEDYRILRSNYDNNESNDNSNVGGFFFEIW